MGLFFEDTKPPQPPPQVIQEAQWWPAVLVGLLLTGIGLVLGWILKPLLTYLFTFEGRTANQIRTQVLTIVILFLTICITAYQFWPVRNLTISTPHTLNVSRYGGRIIFPEARYFKPEGQRRRFSFDSKIYITYAGYTENVVQKMSVGQCQMVTNWNRMGVASINPPVAAEGFADEVRYQLVQPVASLTALNYLWERLTRPKYWFDGTGLSLVMVESEKTADWKRFIDDWDLVWKFDDGRRAFEVRSLWNEHAVLCF